MVVASGANTFAKEMNIRKRVGSIYNKREEDFPSLKDYNDYLEEVEDMIVNLVEGIDVPAIEARISQYQRENADQIMNSQARKAEEYAAALAASMGQLQPTGVDLSLGSEAGMSNVPQGQYAPAVAGGMAQPRPMGIPAPLGYGHDMMGLDYEDEETMRIRAEKAARAGGWSVEISKKRALEDAFASIWGILREPKHIILLQDVVDIDKPVFHYEESCLEICYPHKYKATSESRVETKYKLTLGEYPSI